MAAGTDGGGPAIGRRTRTIPTALRRALMLRDRGYVFPGCTHARFLHGHHIHHWLHGGETSLDNIALLCQLHHRMVHEGGWTVARGEDGELAFRSPTGHCLAHEPPMLEEWAAAHVVEPGPDTNMPRWDGTTPNYVVAVDVLLAAG